MAPSPSSERAEPVVTLSEADGHRLLDIVEEAIEARLAGRPPSRPADGDPPAPLGDEAGLFVTLHVDGRLNGCIGAIEPHGSLASEAARLAVAAAFDDPRLPALRLEDLPDLELEVSVLSPLEPVPAATRGTLRDQLRPGRDGLLIEAGARRGVFLPDVWAQAPDPDDFLDHLLRKAGLAPTRWPVRLRAQRFTTRSFRRRGRHAAL